MCYSVQVISDNYLFFLYLEKLILSFIVEISQIYFIVNTCIFFFRVQRKSFLQLAIRAFKFLKKHYLPVGQIKNRIHQPDSKIHQPPAMGHYFLCTLFIFLRFFILQVNRQSLLFFQSLLTVIKLTKAVMVDFLPLLTSKS